MTEADVIKHTMQAVAACMDTCLNSPPTVVFPIVRKDGEMRVLTPLSFFPPSLEEENHMLEQLKGWISMEGMVLVQPVGLIPVETATDEADLSEILEKLVEGGRPSQGGEGAGHHLLHGRHGDDAGHESAVLPRQQVPPRGHPRP